MQLQEKTALAILGYFSPIKVSIFCPVPFLVVGMLILPPKFFEIRYLPGFVRHSVYRDGQK